MATETAFDEAYRIAALFNPENAEHITIKPRPMQKGESHAANFFLAHDPDGSFHKPAMKAGIALVKRALILSCSPEQGALTNVTIDCDKVTGRSNIKIRYVGAHIPYHQLVASLNRMRSELGKNWNLSDYGTYQHSSILEQHGPELFTRAFTPATMPHRYITKSSDSPLSEYMLDFMINNPERYSQEAYPRDALPCIYRLPDGTLIDEYTCRLQRRYPQTEEQGKAADKARPVGLRLSEQGVIQLAKYLGFKSPIREL